MEPSRHPQAHHPQPSYSLDEAGALVSLDEAEAPADPVTLFARWMDDVVAAGLPEPTAMVLATVSPAGRPRGAAHRVVGVFALPEILAEF